MAKINTLVFDCSGVLIDDIFTVWKADSDAFEACGFDRIENLEKFSEKFQLPVHNFYKAMEVPETAWRKLETQFRLNYPKYSIFIKIFPEVKSVLKRLKQMKIVLGITSNIPNLFLTEHLQNFGISKYFDIVTGQDDCEEKKPSPKPILITKEKMGSNPEQSAYVGDMEEDIVAGKSANVITVAISRDKGSYHPEWKLRRQNPDFLISNLKDLFSIYVNHLRTQG